MDRKRGGGGWGEVGGECWCGGGERDRKGEETVGETKQGAECGYGVTRHEPG